MSASARVRPRLGDIIEIATPDGVAYAHYTHKHPQYGALLRIIPGIHAKPLSNFAELVKCSPQFLTFFPLGAACKRRIVRIAANELLPPQARTFPTFRTGIANQDGKVDTWWLWDGKKEWKVGALTLDTAKLPVRGVCNDTLLVERIVTGWRHEKGA
jgi:hypothetical protein